MEKVHYLIVGAGPSGLAFALAKKLCGEDSFVVLERADSPGGLCRSVQTSMGMADMGGAHMWCPYRDDAAKLVDRLDLSWREVERNSTVVLTDGTEIPYPIEDNLLKLPNGAELALEIIISRLKAEEKPLEDFEKWMRMKFGPLADMYMIPYNRKLWGEPLSRISLKWLHKLPRATALDVVKSFQRKATDRKHLFHAQYRYPTKGGFQAITDGIAERLEGKIVLGEPASSIGPENGRWVVNNKWLCDILVITAPWPVLEPIWDDLPDDVRKACRELESVPLLISLEPGRGGDGPQWTYYANQEPYHRRFFSSRWAPDVNFDFIEARCEAEGDAYETISDESFWNRFAYPVQTITRELAISVISEWSECNNVVPLGRWGLWRYENSDVCIDDAMRAACGEGVSCALDNL